MEQINYSDNALTLDCGGDGCEGLRGAVLFGRYKIGNKLSRGSYGYIYQVEDIVEKR